MSLWTQKEKACRCKTLLRLCSPTCHHGNQKQLRFGIIKAVEFKFKGMYCAVNDALSEMLRVCTYI